MAALALLGGSVPWKGIALACGLFLAVLGWGWLTSHLKREGLLEGQVAEVTGVANANAAKAAAAEADRQAQAAIAAKARQAAAADRSRFERERKAYAHVAPADNGPIAAVLRHELDRLPDPCTADCAGAAIPAAAGH